MHAQMRDQGGTACTASLSDRVGELLAPAHAGHGRQHERTLVDPGQVRLSPAGSKAGGRRIAAASARRTGHDGCVRRKAQRGPCDGGRPGWRGRRGCACAAGSRGSSRDDGCSAGKYACSRVGSRLKTHPQHMGTLDSGWPAGSGACEIAAAWQADRRTLRGRRVPGQTGRRPRTRDPRLSTNPQPLYPPTPRRPQDVHSASPALPLGCGQRLEHRLWTGLLSALPLPTLRCLEVPGGRRGAVHTVWIQCGFQAATPGGQQGRRHVDNGGIRCARRPSVWINRSR